MTAPARCSRLGLLLIAAALLASSCARQQSPTSAPAREGEAEGEPRSLGELEQELEESESRLQTLLAQGTSKAGEARDRRSLEQEEAAPAQAAPAGEPVAPPRPNAAPQAPADAESKADADETAEAPPRVESNCDLACRALASMRRSADGICSIAGQADQRCQLAQERVESARARVEGAGCKCK